MSGLSVRRDLSACSDDDEVSYLPNPLDPPQGILTKTEETPKVEKDNMDDDDDGREEEGSGSGVKHEEEYNNLMMEEENLRREKR